MISCDSGGDDHDDDDDGDDECFVVNCDNVILFGDCEDCYGGDAKMRHLLYFLIFLYFFSRRTSRVGSGTRPATDSK